MKHVYSLFFFCWLLLLLPHSTEAQCLSNGSFENGLTGWTVSGDGQVFVVPQGAAWSTGSDTTSIIFQDGVWTAGVRSNGPGNVTSVGVLTSSEFTLRSPAVTWFQLDEKPGVTVGLNVLTATSSYPFNLAVFPRAGNASNWGSVNLALPSTLVGQKVRFQFWQHTNDEGQGWYTLIDKVCVPCNLAIISPDYDLVFGYLVSTNYTGTEPLIFKAESSVAGVSRVKWNTKLEYRTSGNRCTGCNATDSFMKQISDSYAKSFSSMGGRLTTSATDDNGIADCLDGRNYVVGTEVPQSLIISQLLSSYVGVTPDLMAKLAKKESGIRQFCIAGMNCPSAQPDLYNINEYWPEESFDGGSHIGIMMMPVTMKDAWDWTQNTMDGVNLYKNKVTIGINYERQIVQQWAKTYKVQLRNLTVTERETMGLVLYGPNASTDLWRQYYYPKLGPTFTWDWAVNDGGNIGDPFPGNADGVAYANSVRSQVIP